MLVKRAEKYDKLLQDFDVDEEEAYKALFDAFFIPLCLYSVKFTGCYAQSKDIVQEFFINFYEKKNYKSIKADLRRYLYVSIQNASIAYAKKIQNLSLTGLDNVLNIPDDDNYDAEILSANIEILKKNLSKLSENGYKVIKAVIINNKKYKEVAEELGISVNTVKFHLTKSLRILRENFTFFFFF
ncbi:DNA-directed RNA polymerase sigma-70 factor [Bacteroidia bacterium]|nr:DNA-directed RNA polymerase sigma-70 factor [Bacteroidia bacterium]